jgi:hypothetical protein
MNTFIPTTRRLEIKIAMHSLLVDSMLSPIAIARSCLQGHLDIFKLGLANCCQWKLGGQCIQLGRPT